MHNTDYYGDTNKWFVGIVTDVIDDSFVRVRVFGIHNMHDRNRLPDTDLPPALVVYPTTGGQAGSGSISHNITVDSWVVGFFADGDDAQYPVVTGVINGSKYSMSSYKTGGGEFVGDGYTPDGQVPGGVDPGGTTNIPGDSNAAKVYNYIYAKLQAEGSSNDIHMHTSAAMGVIKLESGFNPAALNPDGVAYGLCQWRSRKQLMFRMYGKTKRLDQQLDFMWYELNGLENKAKVRWLQGTNLPDAVAGFCYFERGEEMENGRLRRDHPNYKKRLNFAYEIYNSAKYTGAGSATTAEQDAASAAAEAEFNRKKPGQVPDGKGGWTYPE